MNEVVLSKRAAGFLKKCREKKLKEALLTAIKQLKENAYAGECKRGDLRQIYCIDVFYHKTNYEIAYTITEENKVVILVLLIGTRENFYQELKRYLTT